MITGTTSDPLSYTSQGSFAITWNFDDGNGNSINVVQNVVINDTENPVAVCQALTIQLNDVTGTIDKIELFCDNKQNSFTYAADSSWTIPKSWGQCSLYVYGTKDTRFNVVEHPKTI